jgi:hypothetical protein
MTIPTVGRVMYYRPHEADANVFPIVPGQPLAALVAAVQNSSQDPGVLRLNLTVSDSNGTPHAMTGVPYYETEADGPTEGGFVHWMPYQVAQAVRHAADPTYASVAKAVAGGVLDLSTKASPSNG